jgi:restriction system protein
MSHKDPKFPWNPMVPVAVTPDEYEQEVVAWLTEAGNELTSFKVRHQAKVEGSSGEYAFDGLAEFVVFGGAKIIVLIECKRHAYSVKRDDVITLEGKLRDVGAHKAMLFSTAGFQSGALKYATARGIATITFIDGKITYQTRSTEDAPDPPPWLNIPRFSGWFLSSTDETIRSRLVHTGSSAIISDWLNKNES